MVKPHLSPRAAAVQLLNGVLLEGKLIAELLAENILAPLAPEARARAQRLALETLRGLERADRLLAKHIRKTRRLVCVISCVWRLSSSAEGGMRMGS